jgi:hypothetical protein
MPRIPVLAAVALATVVWLAASAAPAAAQGGVGIRAGVSADPNQFFVGMHYETEPLVERLRFRPNIEIGFGDDVTLIAINPEFAYWFPRKGRQQWGVYVGGGPALNIYNFGDGRGRGGDDTDVDPGLNFLLGVQHRQGFFAEIKVGAIDSPDFKFAVGYVFE